MRDFHASSWIFHYHVRVPKGTSQKCGHKSWVPKEHQSIIWLGKSIRSSEQPPKKNREYPVLLYLKKQHIIPSGKRLLYGVFSVANRNPERSRGLLPCTIMQSKPISSGSGNLPKSHEPFKYLLFMLNNPLLDYDSESSICSNASKICQLIMRQPSFITYSYSVISPYFPQKNEF